MSVIADRCPAVQVTVVDTNQNRIDAWNSESLPIYEPGLEEIVKRNRGVNLFFSTNIDEAISKADCVFISVNTPTKTSGQGAGKASDLRYLEESARRIAVSGKGHTIVVEKSTLPVRSAETVKAVLKSLGIGKSFEVLSNPEFLAEGSAIKDLLNPDRVLIGGDSIESCLKLAEIYTQWVPNEKILTTNLWSSEMAKLAANAFLAQRVSSINSLSAFCEATGANISEVAHAIGKDTRIGDKFLKSGPGFGGSCFKKDILNLVYLCEYYGLKEVAAYWEQVVIINEWQKNRVAKIVASKLFNTISGKKIAILGFAFKKDTNDCRESPAIVISRSLIDEGANIVVYDPRVSKESVLSEMSSFGSNITSNVTVADDLYSAFCGVDAVVIVTDWDLFKTIDWYKVSEVSRAPAWIFDTRRCIDRSKVESVGLKYWAVGETNCN